MERIVAAQITTPEILEELKQLADWPLEIDFSDLKNHYFGLSVDDETQEAQYFTAPPEFFEDAFDTVTETIFKGYTRK